MSAEMRANTIPNLLKKMIAHVATSAVFVHSVHFVHVKCIKVYEATVIECHKWGGWRRVKLNYSIYEFRYMKNHKNRPPEF